MLWNFIKLSFRKLSRDSSFSALSIIGLTLASVASTIILLYVEFEKSYDDFRSDSIYRVVRYGFQNGQEVGRSAQTVPALASVIRMDMPEVEAAIRFAHTGPFMSDPVMEHGPKNFRESRIYFADEGFLSMFAYKMMAGNAAGALSRPDQVAISQSTAAKYFGTPDVIGKTLTFHRGEQGPLELVVTAVFDDVPINSHFHTDFLISFSTLRLDLDENWDWGNFYTYIKLDESVTNKIIEEKIPTVLENHIGQMLADFLAAGYKVRYELQPIHEIHLKSKLWGELETNGDATTVNSLFTIAIFILIIAWINYINFAIARSAASIKEISIRKISGSNRGQLITQLLTDSALINMVSAALALALSQALLPWLKVSLDLPAALSFNGNSLWILAGIFLLGTIASGLYPAIFISKLSPVALLRARISRSAASLHLNRALIVFQFAASIILIIGTITVYKQLTFIRNRATGLNLDQTLIVKGPAIKDSTYRHVLSFFGNETKGIPGIAGFSVSSSIPGEELHWGRSFYKIEDPSNSIGASIVAIDENFFQLYEAGFVSGENFRDDSEHFRDAIIINETFARALGVNEKKINQIIVWNEGDQQVSKRLIGIVRDFNQQSLKKKIEPIVFTLKKYVNAPWAGEYYSFKLREESLNSSIKEIQQLWSNVFPQNPFDYFFLDEFFDAQYRADRQLGKVFIVFAAFAIFIACLGLFGLTAYMISIRTKEIGVRKVLGSSSFELVRLLSKDYVFLVLVAFVIAVPVSQWLMHWWLSQFEYRTVITIWIFAGAGVTTLALAVVTVGIKSWRAANINPVDALKYE